MIGKDGLEESGASSQARAGVREERACITSNSATLRLDFPGIHPPARHVMPSVPESELPD
jgi:hypothetical protein